jgi:hypothetical protein
MATTMDNLEKLIQMATIEQMYNMLQKMKNNNCCSVNTENDSKTMNDILHQIERINGDSSNQFNNLYNMVNQLSVKINEMETELQELKQSSVKQVPGQQTLDKYFNKQEPIRIDINVIQQEFTEEQIVNPEEKEVCLVEDLEDNANAEREHEDSYNVATNLMAKETNVEQEESIVEQEEPIVEQEEPIVEQEEPIVEQEEPIVEQEEPIVEQEESIVEQEDESSVEDEEEVVTDDDAEQPQPVEEEEEVFEIEIDDVTYYATSEENGILYEVLSDGDVGKKVGIIKDGEPIFN